MNGHRLLGCSFFYANFFRQSVKICKKYVKMHMFVIFVCTYQKYLYPVKLDNELTNSVLFCLRADLQKCPVLKS